jgi:hypothetical protein
MDSLSVRRTPCGAISEGSLAVAGLGGFRPLDRIQYLFRAWLALATNSKLKAIRFRSLLPSPALRLHAPQPLAHANAIRTHTRASPCKYMCCTPDCTRTRAHTERNGLQEGELTEPCACIAFAQPLLPFVTIPRSGHALADMRGAH